MTRFEMEISGKLGEFWKNNAEKEVKRMMENAKNNATVEEDGAIKWNSNGNYLPADCVEKLVYGGFDFDAEATAKKRERQNGEFIESYKEKMRNHKYTAEELGEMENSFGKGSTVVDVFTGRKFRF